MFDIGTDELLFTAVVAIIVIGPKDLPRALRMAGGWIAKVRRVSGHFKSGVEEMIRQAELEDMEKKWREKNEAIMKEESAVAADSAITGSPDTALPDYPAAEAHHADSHAAGNPADPHPPALLPAMETPSEPAVHLASPELPLAPPTAKP